MSYWVYRYGIQPGKWSKVLLETTSGFTGNEALDDAESQSQPPSPGTHTRPRSRYAGQVVYNPKTKAVFIHGGNAGKDECLPLEVAPPPIMRTNSGDSHESGDTSDAEKENRPEVEQRHKEEIRLNDFWKIKLHRYDY